MYFFCLFNRNFQPGAPMLMILFCLKGQALPMVPYKFHLDNLVEPVEINK